MYINQKKDNRFVVLISVLIIQFALVVLAAHALNSQPFQETLDQARKLEIDRVFAHFKHDTPGAALAVTIQATGQSS